MPKREVTSAPWAPVPARACTGKAPRARQHRAVGRLSAGAPRLHKSCRLRRPQSKGRSCRSGRARRDPRARGGRRHLSERPGWPRGAPISRGSTVSMIAFGGRRGPHRSGSRCRGRPIERREAGREGCLWPNAASQGRPPDGSGGESERSTQNGRAKTLVVVVVVVRTPTPNYLRQASQNLGKYIVFTVEIWILYGRLEVEMVFILITGKGRGATGAATPRRSRCIEPAGVAAGVVRLTFLWSNRRRTLSRHRPPNLHRPTTHRPFAVLLSLSRHQPDDA